MAPQVKFERSIEDEVDLLPREAPGMADTGGESSNEERSCDKNAGSVCSNLLSRSLILKADEEAVCRQQGTPRLGRHD